MMEVPTIIKTWIDTDGVTVYTVQWENGSTSDMTVEQYDYLKASAQAVADLDAKATDQIQQTETSAADDSVVADASDVYVVSADDTELPFEGSLTAYDDAAADTPALYANLTDVSNSFTNIMDWFGDTFFIERTQTVHKSGYTSERYSYSGSTQLIQLPYEEDVTETVQVLNPQACVSALLVVLVFVTTVTWIKSAIFGRLS